MENEENSRVTKKMVDYAEYRDRHDDAPTIHWQDLGCAQAGSTACSRGLIKLGRTGDKMKGETHLHFLERTF
jgi:hypothetical protein